MEELTTYNYTKHPEHPGMLQYAGRKTPEAIMAEVKELLQNTKHHEYENLWNGFEWFTCTPSFVNDSAKEELPEEGIAIAHWTRGGSEGYIINIGILVHKSAGDNFDVQYLPISSGKTFCKDLAKTVTNLLSDIIE